MHMRFMLILLLAPLSARAGVLYCHFLDPRGGEVVVLSSWEGSKVLQAKVVKTVSSPAAGQNDAYDFEGPSCTLTQASPPGIACLKYAANESLTELVDYYGKKAVIRMAIRPNLAYQTTADCVLK